jgi:polyhydroxyalkanoate synthesis regulator phasin
MIQNVSKAKITLPTYDLTAALTPEALMTYCSTRLRGLDEQVNVAFHKQEVANADSKVLSSLASSLNTPSGDTDLACGGGVECALVEANKMLDAAKQIGDPAVRQKLIDGANAIIDRAASVTDARFWGTGATYDIKKALADGRSPHEIKEAIDSTAQNVSTHTVDGKISAPEWKTMSSDMVQNISKDMNSSTELSMINLQSLMSQRQSSVQLITNMVQSLGDQLNKIASNIGH